MKNDIIVDSTFKNQIFDIYEEASKFDDSLVGYAVLFSDMDTDYAKSIGIR